MSTQQALIEDSSSSSSDSSSCSSRETSPVRAPDTATAARVSKRKSKSRSSSSSKRSKTEDKKKKSGKQKHVEQQRAAVQPRAGSSKVTAKDIMGTDSDFEEDPTGGKKDELLSYLCRRGSNGVSKQVHSDKQGLRFVDFRLYMCNEIENITPMNRWRQAIVTLKTKLDDESPAYRYLVKFLKEIKKDFKDCPVTYTSTPNQ